MTSEQNTDKHCDIRGGVDCLDCGINTAEETDGKNINWYMLNDNLWNQINPDKIGCLCISCAEKRLGRKLKPTDFGNQLINLVNDYLMGELSK